MSDQKSIKDLQQEWNRLSENERSEVYQDFQDDCIN